MWLPRVLLHALLSPLRFAVDGALEAVAFRPRLNDVRTVGDPIQQCFTEPRVREDLRPF